MADREWVGKVLDKLEDAVEHIEDAIQSVQSGIAVIENERVAGDYDRFIQKELVFPLEQMRQRIVKEIEHGEWKSKFFTGE